MRRRSTGLASGSTISSSNPDAEETKNTGLRPSWGDFWQVDVERLSTVRIVYPLAADSRTCTVSTISTLKSETNFKNVKFISGSEWIGEWDKLGMCGMGVYKMPHGVVYEGSMNTGEFEGVGLLTYPNGGSLEGFWHEGKLKYCQYEYSDGLKRESPVGWTYCQMPDRRFYSEMIHGLRPADREQLTSEEPSWEIPAGQFDVGDGLYNPRTKCVTDPSTGEILRIPTINEERWILENARSADVGTVGYRPDLYENWFKKRDEDNLRELTEDEREILALIWQEDSDLESRGGSWRCSQDRSTSLQSKLDSLREVKSTSSVWSRTTPEFEVAMRKLVREKSVETRFRYSNYSNILQNRISDPEIRESDEYSIVKLLHDIAMSYSGQIDRVLYNVPSAEQQTPEEPSSSLPDLTNRTPSNASVSTKPFSFSAPGSVTGPTPPQQKSFSDEMVFNTQDTAGGSDVSQVRLEIDYTEIRSISSFDLKEGLL